MSRSLLDSSNPRDDVASLICVDSCASYFLYDHVMNWGSDVGPDDPLRKELETYFDTARAAIPHLSLLGPSTLANLQALQFGVSILIDSLYPHPDNKPGYQCPRNWGHRSRMEIHKRCEHHLLCTRSAQEKQHLHAGPYG